MLTCISQIMAGTKEKYKGAAGEINEQGTENRGRAGRLRVVWKLLAAFKLSVH
jgi:hypothetical protein